MNPKPGKHRLALSLLATLSCWPVGLRAQAVDGALLIAQGTVSKCLADAPTMLDRPEFQPLLQKNPLDINRVCACSQSSFLGDNRIREHLRGEQQVILQRIASPEFKAYAGMRFSSALLSCIATELDASLAKSSWPL